MNRSTLLLTLLVSCYSLACGYQEEMISKNEPAPTIKAKWMGEEPDFEGKVVVMDFWLTSCGPCVASIPHMNEMVDIYKDKDIVFLAITDESAKKVKEFQKNRKIDIKSYVGIDSFGKLRKKYGVNSFPESFIIDSNGVLLWSGSPMLLSTQLIDDVLGTDESRLDSELVEVKTDKEHLTIRLSKRKTMLSKLDEPAKNIYRGVYVGVDLRSFLASLAKVSGEQVLLPEELTDKRYDITYEDLQYNGNLSGLNSHLIDLVTAEMGYKLNHVRKEVEGLSLVVRDERLLRKNKTRKKTSLSNDKSLSGAYTLQDLAIQLNKSFGQLVNTRLDNEQRYNLKIDLTDLNNISETLLRKYGLELVRGPIEVETLSLISL